MEHFEKYYDDKYSIYNLTNKDEFVEYTVEVKQEKLDIIKINLSKLDMAKIQEIMVRYNVTSFNDAELVPSKCLDEILDLI